MLNIQDHYTYKNKSIDKVNNIAIHPLSNKSLHDYISNTSYANKFLDKTKLIKSKNFKGEKFIDNEEDYNNNYKKSNRNASNVYFNDFEKEKRSTMYTTLYDKQTNAEQNKKNMLSQLNYDKSFMKLVSRYNTSNHKNSNKHNLLGKESNYNPINNMNLNCNENNTIKDQKLKSSSLLQMRKSISYEEQNKQNDKASGLESNLNKKNTNNNITSNNFNNFSNNNVDFNHKSTSRNLNKPSFNDINENNKLTSKNKINHNQININSNNLLDKANNPSQYSTIVVNDFQNQIKKKLNSSEEKSKTNNKIKSKSIDGLKNLDENNNNAYLDFVSKSNAFKTSKSTLKHDGFTLNNIPRVDDLFTMSDPKFLNYSHTNFHCKKIINSMNMSNNLKVKDEIQKISKVELRKVNRAKNPKDFVEKLCDLENSKYGRIFNMQKSKDFLLKKQLPEIKYEKKNIEIDNNYYNNGNSKFMGVQYNPFNYDLIASKNRTKRNVFGTLFIN